MGAADAFAKSVCVGDLKPYKGLVFISAVFIRTSKNLFCTTVLLLCLPV